MKIQVSQYAGFCFGVNRALKIVFDILDKAERPIQMLGNLVHNEEVVKKLKNKGIKVINSLDQVEKGVLIITAHGIDPKIINQAKKKGLKVVDTTCPMVLKVHQLAKVLAKEGRKIILFGDKDHIEVKGINGAINNQAVIIDSLEKAKSINFKSEEKIGFISQTTQNVEEFEKIAEVIKSKCKDVKVFNTICQSTRGRQEDVRNLAQNNDLIIIVGSRTSANTKRLFEIARSLNQKTFWVTRADQIKKEWFLDSVESIGVSAGASTPPWIIKEVVEKLKSL